MKDQMVYNETKTRAMFMETTGRFRPPVVRLVVKRVRDRMLCEQDHGLVSQQRENG